MLGTGTGQVASLGLPNTSSLLADGNAGLPFRSMDLNGRLQLTYIRRTITSNPGISYAVQFSDSLGGWVVNPSASESAAMIDDTFQRVTVTDSAAGPQRFARILVTSP